MILKLVACNKLFVYNQSLLWISSATGKHKTTAKLQVNLYNLAN